MKTLKEVQEWCDTNGVELVIERSVKEKINHVHVNIDRVPQVFRTHDLHNLGLWDSTEKPNWKIIGQELLDANLGPCTDPDCEWCIHGLEQ